MNRTEREIYFAVLMSNVNAGRHAYEASRSAQQAINELRSFNKGPIARIISAIRIYWRMRNYPKVPA